MRRTGLIAVLAGALLLSGVLAAGLRRWPVSDPGWRHGVLRGLETASGLTATASGPLSLRLLPWPTISLGGVALRGADGAVSLDAAVFHSRLSLGSLLAGVPRGTTASFDQPLVVLDVDRLAPLLAGLTGSGGPAPVLELLHAARVVLHDAVVRLRSQDPRRDTIVTGLSLAYQWPSDEAGASLSGSATWRGIAGEFGLDIDRPAEVLRGGQAIASARVKSGILELDSQATLYGTGSRQMLGKLSASTPDLPAFLRLVGEPAPQVDGIRQARLDGTAELIGDTLSFDPATLDLDDMRFDGALTIRAHDGRIGLAGTLATDRIAMDPFFRALPQVLSPTAAWSDKPLGTASVAYDDIDLRISASRASIGPFLMEDGSLSMQSGDGRMELSIGEARAYDGLLKGRIVATLAGGVTDVRADATLSRLDVRSALKRLPGGYRASGTVFSRISVGASGRTPADLARSLDGHVELTVHDGALGTKLLTSLTRSVPKIGAAGVPLLALGSVPFEAASLDASIDKGLVTIGSGSIVWPDLRAGLSGLASIPDQTLNLRAAVPSDGPAGGRPTFLLTGPWWALQLLPATAAR